LLCAGFEGATGGAATTVAAFALDGVATFDAVCFSILVGATLTNTFALAAEFERLRLAFPLTSAGFFFF
jgi:hypothetical protein